MFDSIDSDYKTQEQVSHSSCAQPLIVLLLSGKIYTLFAVSGIDACQYIPAEAATLHLPLRVN